MKRVLINRCYGGFQVSNEGVILYEKKLGNTLYEAPNKWGEQELFTDPECKNKHYFFGEEHRDEKTLLEVFDELGSEKFSADFSKIVVDEIPNDMEWYISEYDGMERIEECNESEYD